MRAAERVGVRRPSRIELPNRRRHHQPRPIELTIVRARASCLRGRACRLPELLASLSDEFLRGGQICGFRERLLERFVRHGGGRPGKTRFLGGGRELLFDGERRHAARNLRYDRRACVDLGDRLVKTRVVFAQRGFQGLALILDGLPLAGDFGLRVFLAGVRIDLLAVGRLGACLREVARPLALEPAVRALRRGLVADVHTRLTLPGPLVNRLCECGMQAYTPVRQRCAIYGCVLVERHLLGVVELCPPFDVAGRLGNLRGNGEVADWRAVVTDIGGTCFRARAAGGRTRGVVHTTVPLPRRALIGLGVFVAEGRGD